MRMAKTVQNSLDKAHCEYDIVSHPHSASSLETARLAGIPAERVAKSVILDDRHGHYLMAVLPASRHLDLSKVRGSSEWQVTRESTCRTCSTIANAAPCLHWVNPTGWTWSSTHS